MGVRFVQTAAGTVDAAGNCSILFQPPPLGMVNTGTITVYDSKNATVWSLTMAGASIGNTLGTSPAAGIQQYPNEQITAAATNLTPGVQYHATFIGSSDLEADAPPPGFAGGSAEVVTAGASRLALAATLLSITRPATYSAYNGVAGIPLQPNERSLIITIEDPQGSSLNPYSLTVTGDQSGTLWYSGSVEPEIYKQTSAVFISRAYPPTSAPAYGSEDSTVTVEFGLASTAPYALSNFYVTVLAVPDPEINGSPGNPTFVQLFQNGAVISAANPLQVEIANPPASPAAVELFDGTATEVGTTTNPLVTQRAYPAAGQTRTAWASTTTTSTVLAGPAAGLVRVIDALNWYTASPSAVTLDTATPVTTGQGIYLSGSASVPDLTPAPGIFLLNGQTLYGLAAALGETLTVWYHDEAL